MSIGLGLGISLGQRYGGAAAVYDPSALSLTGWFRDFTALDWAGTASAGTSAAADLEDGGGLGPTAGDLNGHGTADFNGTDQALIDGETLADIYFSASAYTISALVMPRSASAPAGAIYDNEQIVADNGGVLGIAWSTSGVAAWHFDTDFRETAWVPCSADAFHRIEMTFGAGTLSISVDGGTPATRAVGNVAGLGACRLRVARNYGSVFTSMRLADLMMAATLLDGATLTSIRTSYDANRYGV
jgi:hypothetical protein